MKIGYIVVHNTNGKKTFIFREYSFTRKITSKSDKVYSKGFYGSFDYEEIVSNAEIMKNNPRLILVSEPFLLDAELEDKCEKWVEWANKADPSEYDPFASKRLCK